MSQAIVVPDRAKRHASYPFTINNYTQAELDALIALTRNEEVCHQLGIRLLVFGKEVAPTTGTPHLQGYIHFRPNSSKSMQATHRIPGMRRAALMANQRGTPQQCVDYCTKGEENIPGSEQAKILGETYWQYGTVPEQGKRTDLQETLKVFTTSGFNLKQVAIQCPDQFVKYHRGFQAMASLINDERRSWKTQVIWLHGPTGTGKSMTAYKLIENGVDCYYKDCHSGWWDGYTTQPVCILDDYRTEMCTFSALLNLLDRYPLSLQVKGSQVQCLFKYLIVTTPKPPASTWAKQDRENLLQLKRRVEHTFQFRASPEEPLSPEDTVSLGSLIHQISMEHGSDHYRMMYQTSLETVSTQDSDEEMPNSQESRILMPICGEVHLRSEEDEEERLSTRHRAESFDVEELDEFFFPSPPSPSNDPSLTI
jgi:hypothetical protein